MLRDIKAERNALSEDPPMPARSVLAALLFLVTTLPAAAQDVVLPREPQIGPRP